jgi:hypothetical protein
LSDIYIYISKAVKTPRKRWEDSVQRKISQDLGIRRCRREAKDKEEWRCLSRDARTQNGL